MIRVKRDASVLEGMLGKAVLPIYKLLNIQYPKIGCNSHE